MIAPLVNVLVASSIKCSLCYLYYILEMCYILYVRSCRRLFDGISRVGEPPQGERLPSRLERARVESYGGSEQPRINCTAQPGMAGWRRRRRLRGRDRLAVDALPSDREHVPALAGVRVARGVAACRLLPEAKAPACTESGRPCV